MPETLWIAAAAVGLGWLFSWRPAPHARQIAKAHRVLRRLGGLDGPGRAARVIAYLRKVDPYVFEELLLNAFARRGVAVRRNRRYSGDGGIDGYLQLDGGICVQAKRYRGHIRAADVAAFKALVAARRCRGVFIHTGRTGRGARAAAGSLEILSGQRLVDLVTGDPLMLFGLEL